MLNEQNDLPSEPSTSHNNTKLMKDLRIRLKFSNEEEWYTATVIQGSGEVGGKYPNCWDIILDSDRKHYDVNFDSDVSSWQSLITGGSPSLPNTALLANPTDEFLACETLLGATVDAVMEAKRKESG